LSKTIGFFIAIFSLSALTSFAETFEERRVRERQQELAQIGARGVAGEKVKDWKSRQSSPPNSPPRSPSSPVDLEGLKGSGAVKAQAERGLRGMVPRKADLEAVSDGSGPAAPKAAVARRPGLDPNELKAALAQRSSGAPKATSMPPQPIKAPASGPGPASGAASKRINPAALLEGKFQLRPRRPHP
jgi:hypothetical protein